MFIFECSLTLWGGGELGFLRELSFECPLLIRNDGIKILMSNVFEIDFGIKVNDKKSQCFDLW